MATTSQSESPIVPATLASFDSLPDAANVDIRTVAGLYGCTVVTVWRRVAKGLIPLPRKFGGSSRWNVGELRTSLAAAETVR